MAYLLIKILIIWHPKCKSHSEFYKTEDSDKIRYLFGLQKPKLLMISRIKTMMVYT